MKLVFVLTIVIGCAAGAPLLDWGKQDGGGLIGKVATLKQNVYEKKRELLNGINEKVSKMLWIPPWPSTSTTTEESPVNGLPHQHDPVSEPPSIWWWQTTEKPSSSSSSTIRSTTISPTVASVSIATSTHPSNDDRLIFTVADTDELEQPNVFIYARSSFIPPEQRLTDSMEYFGPIVARGPQLPEQHTDRLIVL